MKKLVRERKKGQARIERERTKRNGAGRYTYGYDGLSRPTSINSVIDGLSTFSYDAASQVVGADHATSGQVDAS